MAEKQCNLLKNGGGTDRMLKKASGASLSDMWSDAMSKATSLIYVSVQFMDGTTKRDMVLTIIKDLISASTLSFMNGANVSAGYLYVLNVTLTSISPAVYANGTNITSSSTFDVYYD